MSHAGTAMKPISIKTHPTMLMSGTKRRTKPTHIVPERFLIRLASSQERLILSCNSTAELATWVSIVIEQYLQFSIPELMNSLAAGYCQQRSAANALLAGNVIKKTVRCRPPWHKSILQERSPKTENRWSCRDCRPTRNTNVQALSPEHKSVTTY